MKIEEFNELKIKSANELDKMLSESRDKLWTLKNDLERGKVKNVSEIRAVKKLIAQLKTLLNIQKKD